MQAEVHNKVKIGLKWNMINQIVTQIVFVWFGIYLARLLGPAAYGLVGMITVFAGFANIFVDFGFTSAIIYFQELDDNKLSSVFWFNMAMAIIIYLLFYLLAPYISYFYNEPKLEILTKVVTLSIIINSFSSLQNAILSKNIDFKTKITTSWISTIVSYVIAFFLAYKGYGVWSLVFQMLAVSFINSVFLWQITKWRPKFYFSLADIRPLFKYGSGIAGTNMLGYLTRNIDNLLVGKFLGNAALGLYSRSYSLMLLPISNVTSVFSKVLFPAFSILQNDKQALAKYYLKVIKYIAFVTFPMMFGLSSIAKEFVLIFLGPEWYEAILIIKMLSILGAFQSILSLNGIIYNSTGNSLKALKVTLILNLFLIPSWLIGLYLGNLNGLVLAYLIVGTLGALPIYAFALKQINLKLSDAFREIKWIALCSVAVFCINVPVTYLITSNIMALLVKLILAASIYIFLMRILDYSFYRNLLDRFKLKIGL